ncbi:Starch-binding associating with outer membrane [Pustulibacterium marinum]|uniref:Starch-binding associating with outer membrane n=1 Tax=Pustulibacterium marinum TaxID=1224947 RepID=A0A1I7EZ37_9FLAO|nr:RagB/SusD family nutrient uptake outer membrane protein [Pustulibacterium marinum]SFU29167.1 Starch-binding associating with outer membrane [Pustulibacterium marinum]
MKYFYKLSYIIIAAVMFTACMDDLDQYPTNPTVYTEEDVFANASEAKSALAKLYAGFSLTGQTGATGDSDITAIGDEGATQFTRLLFILNELPTDEAVNGWGDAGVPNFHNMNWSSTNIFLEATYYRLALEVSYCNSFIENAQALSDNTDVQHYIAEARFMRAYAYSYLVDFFGNVPITTEVSTNVPEQNSREEIFAFIESELLEIQDLLPASGTSEYGRVDEVAAWALLSRIYLNAESWIGEDRYADCVTYSQQVINSTYTLNTTDANGNGSAYDELFLADNDTNGAQNEFIFTANFDGVQSQTYGGTTYLVCAAIGGDMVASDYGVNGGWSGNRVTKGLVEKFNDAITASDEDGNPTAWSDSRAMFFTNGQNYEIETIANTFTDGYASTKYKNLKSDGSLGNDPNNAFVDTDIALIRVAEIYLNYAEAVLRGGGGSTSDAALYINELRERAYGNSSANITSGNLTLDFILDERARELQWEGFRRTDLIRYGYFTSNSYLWPFKGGSVNGIAVDGYRDIYPIPSAILGVNPNLTQNPGY